MAGGVPRNDDGVMADKNLKQTMGLTMATALE